MFVYVWLHFGSVEQCVSHTPMTTIIIRQLSSVFITSDVGSDDVGGYTWRQVDTSALRFDCMDSFA